MKKVFWILFVFASCSTQTNDNTSKLIDSSNKVSKRISHDTLFISTTAVVTYVPDSSAIAKRKKSIGEENFMIGADDYLNYLHLAHDFFEKTKTTIIQAKTNNILCFIASDGSKDLIKLDTLPDLWGIYLFNPLQRAKQIDMTIYEDEYKGYFKK